MDADFIFGLVLILFTIGLCFYYRKESKKKIGRGINAHLPSSRCPARSHPLFDSIKQVDCGEHDRKEDYGHDCAGFGVVHGPVATWPHNECVNLVGG